MLTCHDVTDRASALQDGELSWRERLAIRMHLLMCVHCRRFARQFRALVEGLKLRGRAERVPPELVDRIMSRIDDEPEAAPPQPPADT